jgi:hypothetical protein
MAYLDATEVLFSFLQLLRVYYPTRLIQSSLIIITMCGVEQATVLIILTESHGNQ